MSSVSLPYLGFGLGLRKEHYRDILAQRPDVDWFEVLSENYLVPGGKPLYFLDEIHQHYPMVLHGVSLSIGSTDPLNLDYLKQLSELADRVDAHWISDHLCWTGVEQTNTHDLLPLPYTEEAIDHVAGRIRQVQDYLGRQMLIENVSSYLSYKHSVMPEWEFLTEVVTRADCLMLLDVNNIYVSSVNHEFDPLDYLNHVPVERVQQIHLAGHSNEGDYIIDTHDHPVADPVWRLYEQAVARFGQVSTMIERDDNIPELTVVLDELRTAQNLATNVLQKAV
uniref:UPF0276 protein HELGO_WM22477 n=1 Tax=uncultured Thiotrichaceae bacterium TaxID=298394 RepID=A0A6S6U4Q0_9GAMM|nr:MAG: Uncharacterized protein conserved in bacteria, NMA0228-like [uncultured Thiotrichaceae bacterium]